MGIGGKLKTDIESYLYKVLVQCLPYYYILYILSLFLDAICP